MSTRAFQQRALRFAKSLRPGDRIVHNVHGPGEFLAGHGSKCIIRLDVSVSGLGRTFVTQAMNLKREG